MTLVVDANNNATDDEIIEAVATPDVFYEFYRDIPTYENILLEKSSPSVKRYIESDSNIKDFLYVNKQRSRVYYYMENEIDVRIAEIVLDFDDIAFLKVRSNINVV